MALEGKYKGGPPEGPGQCVAQGQHAGGSVSLGEFEQAKGGSLEGPHISGEVRWRVSELINIKGGALEVWLFKG